MPLRLNTRVFVPSTFTKSAPMSRLRPSSALLAALMLLAQACVLDGLEPDPGGAADPNDPNGDGPVPRVEESACAFSVPDSLGLTEGTHYECGDLIVFENRSAPARTIRVHYIRLFSSAPSNNATIFFDGGPGANGASVLLMIAAAGPDMLAGLTADGDFLSISQRGTSLSMPSLLCADQTDIGDEATAVNRCGQELSSIAHLPSYNTAYNADDVDDLRGVLGYDKLNLYGISYGTRLGLEVVRRHGDTVRSAVLDSVVPPHVVWPAAVPASFYSALVALNASCALDPLCGGTFGDLTSKLSGTVSSFQQTPLSFNADTGTVTLDGVAYAVLVYQMLFSNDISLLPLIISDLAERRTDRVGNEIASRLGGTGDNASGISVGLYYSIVCGEVVRSPEPGVFDTLNANVPAAIRDALSFFFESPVEICPGWPRGEVRPALSEPVASDVPALVISGEVDPVTPPSFGDTVASTLSNRTVVTFANTSHAATWKSECGWRSFLPFIADPSSPLDTRCAGAVLVVFAVPGSPVAAAAPRAVGAVDPAGLGDALLPPSALRRLRDAIRRR